ncbi:hypothetical protein J3Q64DRAFT_1822181 [Phycomyces blakesleeanus]|uniref:Uncharacterized protein n=1 Tax=Phycomyces blakesleeanus TaxID=4837 RepID=A0ABR3AY72_PHYBL
MTASNFLYKASWFKLGQQKLSKSTGSLNTISTLPVPGIRSYHKVTLIAAVFLIYFHRWIIFYRCRKPSSTVILYSSPPKTETKTKWALTRKRMTFGCESQVRKMNVKTTLDIKMHDHCDAYLMSFKRFSGFGCEPIIFKDKPGKYYKV